MRPRSCVALCFFALAACSRWRGASSSKDASPTDSGAAALASVEVVALVRDEAFNQAAWTSGGAVAAVSHRRFWWLRPQDEATAKTTSFESRVDGMVTAEKADVTVVQSGQVAHVFQGATQLRKFELAAKDEQLKSISSTGKVLVTGLPRSGDSMGHAYDVASGKRLGDIWEHAQLSDDGEFALTFEGLARVDTGAVVARFDSASGHWIDGRVVNFSHTDGHTLVDPKNPTPKKIASRCVLSSAGEARGEDQQEATAETDVVGKRVVTFCRGTLEVVRLDDLSAIRVKVTRPQAPRIRFGLDGTLLLVWEGAGRPLAEAVDLDKRKTRRLDTVPPYRDGLGKPVVEFGSQLSGDGKLQVGVALGRLVVSDVATKKERVGWGRPGHPGSPEIAAFIHAGGLEIISEGQGGRERLRLGPLAPPLTSLPPLAPGSGCGGGAMLRALTAVESRFEAYEGAACVCTAARCAPGPRGILAQVGDRALVAQKDGTAMFRVGTQQHLFDPETYRARGDIRRFSAAFLGDDVLAVLTRAGADPAELTELAVPGMTPLRRRMLAFDADRVSGTASTIFVSLSFVGEVTGTVFARAADAAAGPQAEVDAWATGGIVRFPDGRVERFGTETDDLLVCLDRDGTARRFASCRGQVEAKGRFRVD